MRQNAIRVEAHGLLPPPVPRARHRASPTIERSSWHGLPFSPSKQVLQPIPEAPFALSPVGMDVVARLLDAQHAAYRLDLGDPFGMQRADIRTIGVDEVQHNDLAAEVRHVKDPAIGVLQREAGSFTIHRLEILLLVIKLLLQIVQRMRQSRWGKRSCNHNGKNDSRQNVHTVTYGPATLQPGPGAR